MPMGQGSGGLQRSGSSTSSTYSIFYRISTVDATKNSYEGSKISDDGSKVDDLYVRSGGFVGIYSELDFIEYCQAWWFRHDDAVDSETLFISQEASSTFLSMFVSISTMMIYLPLAVPRHTLTCSIPYSTPLSSRNLQQR